MHSPQSPICSRSIVQDINYARHAPASTRLMTQHMAEPRQGAGAAPGFSPIGTVSFIRQPANWIEHIMWGRACAKTRNGGPCHAQLAPRLRDPYIPTAPRKHGAARDRRRSPSQTRTGGERSSETASEWPILHICTNPIDEFEMLIFGRTPLSCGSRRKTHGFFV